MLLHLPNISASRFGTESLSGLDEACIVVSAGDFDQATMVRAGYWMTNQCSCVTIRVWSLGEAGGRKADVECRGPSSTGFDPQHHGTQGDGEVGMVGQNVLKILRGRAQVGASSCRGFAYIDLFAGIGGLRRGFDTIGGQCVFTSEWNRFSQQTYEANFGTTPAIAGDITEIAAESVPPHDVLLAGFPCQPFSIAGVSKKNALKQPHGFRCETQGTLFFDVARIVDHHRPAFFLLENVKNLVNHDRGRTFRVIRSTLENDLGYTVHTRVLNARSWLPQHRERIFIAGFRDEAPGFSFDDMPVPDPAEGPKLSAVLHPQDGSEKAEDGYTTGPLAQVLPRYTLSEHLWSYLQAYAEKHRRKGNGFGFGLFGPDDVARTLSARYYKDGSEILIRQPGNRPRRLTPRECARLMGFDQPDAPAFHIPVSDTQAYRQFGNAVAVPVAEAIARHVAPWMLAAIPSQESRVA